MSVLAFATAQQEAYHYLRERILGGSLSGNDRVNPAEIAKVLGISRMPVREALRQLDSEGLVVMRPNRGATVTHLTSFEVEELFEIRVALEVLAARVAVPHLTNDVKSELISLRQRMDAARHDPLVWVKRHDEFHQFICEIGNRRRLAHEVARIRNSVQPYVLMYMHVYNTIEIPGLEHSSLIDALASGDVQLAERVMREHVTEPGQGIVEFLRQRETSKGTTSKVGQSDNVPIEMEETAASSV